MGPERRRREEKAREALEQEANEGALRDVVGWGVPTKGSPHTPEGFDTDDTTGDRDARANEVWIPRTGQTWTCSGGWMMREIVLALDQERP